MVENPKNWSPEVRKINDAIVRAEANRRDVGMEVMLDLCKLAETEDRLKDCPNLKRAPQGDELRIWADIVSGTVVRYQAGPKKKLSLAAWVYQILVARGLFDSVPSP